MKGNKVFSKREVWFYFLSSLKFPQYFNMIKIIATLKMQNLRAFSSGKKRSLMTAMEQQHLRYVWDTTKLWESLIL